jgi:hypothetical protein
MTVSIITAAKGRVDTTKKAFDSIWENAHHPYDIEHLIMMDCNDKPLHAYMGVYMKSYPKYKIKAYTVCHCKNKELYHRRKIHRDYWNPLAKNCSGDIIFGLCNDTVILTKGFDEILHTSLVESKVKHKHSYFQFLVDDDSSNDISPRIGDMCSWIILTKEAIKNIGGIVPDEITFSGGDSYVYNLFKHTVVPSQINLRDQIKTLHLSHYNASLPIDDVTKNKPYHNADIDVNLADSKGYSNRLDLSVLKEYYANTSN